MDCFTVIYGFWWGTASNSIVYIPVDSYRWLGRTEDKWHQAACEMDDALENQGHSCERKTVWSQWNCSGNSSTLVSLMMLVWHILTSTTVFVQLKQVLKSRTVFCAHGNANGASIKWYVQSLMHSETDDAPTNSRNTETDDAPTNRRHGFHSCLIMSDIHQKSSSRLTRLHKVIWWHLHPGNYGLLHHSSC